MWDLLKLSIKYGIVGYYLSLNKMAFVGLIKAIDKVWHRGLLFKLENVEFVGVIKAFHEVWHRGLLYKLEQNGICGTY